MLESWLKAYGERWGLPEPAVEELQDILTAIAKGEIAASDVDTRMPVIEEPGTLESHPMPSTSPNAVERYEDIAFIARGGMGEVRRVWDCVMNRPLAMKILRRELVEREDLVARFKEEAEATAQLEHPAVVPIHDMGSLPDGRHFFTMKEVRGRTMLDVIDEVHTCSVESWGTGPNGWTLVKLVRVFAQVCDCIAYAHSRSVLHRDIKPSNVMVGAFGEVAVMDWGLAKISGSSDNFGDSVAMSMGAGPVITERSREGWVTRSGSIAGTPNYMPPEQATGEHSRVGPWSDVYALGAILYHIIADRPPYDGRSIEEVVDKVLTAAPPSPRPTWRSDRTGPAIEDELVTICNKAMSRELADRYMDAAALAEAVRDWLSDVQVREQALKMVSQADQIQPEIDELRRTVAQLDAKADRHERDPDADPQSRAIQDLQAQTAGLRSRLTTRQQEYRRLLEAAITWSPNLPEAQARLSRIRPSTSKKTGPGRVDLITDQPGVEVLAHPIQVRERRFEEGEPIPLGPTPLLQAPLPEGSWVLRAGPLVYPVFVRSGSSTSEGLDEPPVLQGSTFPATERYIPAGLCQIGSDEDDSERSLWIEDFVIQTHPVTCAEYQAFLLDLGVDAPDHIPHDGRGLLWTHNDDLWSWPSTWEAMQPVRNIKFDSAIRYALWWSQRTAQSWRLPMEYEWEKAARGADSRRFPWGNYLDPSWACVATSHARPPLGPSRVDAYPLDSSPYGVRGLAGNVQDWCVSADASLNDLQRLDPRFRILRGGHWMSMPRLAAAFERTPAPLEASGNVGFRLVRSI